MNALAIYEPPQTKIIPFTPKLDDVTECFLRAFIGTSSPIRWVTVHQTTIAYPMAYPRELRFLMKRALRSQCAQTPDVIYLDAPASHCPVSVGDTLPLAGFAQVCTVTAICEKWGQTWVTVQAQIGKHLMTKTVDISQIIPNKEQS